MPGPLRKWARAFVVSAAVAVLSSGIEGHSPYRPAVVFLHDCPAFPAAPFAAGNLGAVLTGWDSPYLVVSYRYLTGKPLTPQEQKSFWEQFHSDYPPKKYDWREERAASPTGRWVKARAKFRKGKPPTVQGQSDWWEWSDGENCQQGAFEQAIRTLQARARAFGARSRELQEWIDGQDQVFLNCAWVGRKEVHASIPAPLPATAPALLKADRAYQIAAAHFYAGDYPQALAEFDAISRDSASPWKDWAPYLEGRVLLRSAFPPDFAGFYQGSRFDRDRLTDAERRFEQAEQASTNQAIRRSARGLLSFIAFHLRPEEQARLVAERLGQPQASDTFGQDSRDFGTFISRRFGEPPDFPGLKFGSKEYEAALQEWLNKRFGELENDRAASEITDWVMTMGYFAPDAERVHAVGRWQSNPSLLWLVAAMSWARGKDDAVPEMLARAADVPPSSPAYLTVLIHRARLLNERGDFAEARKVLDNAFEKPRGWPAPVINLLKSQRFLAASNMADLVRYSWRQPIAFSNGARTAGEAEYCRGGGSDVKCDPNVFIDPTSKRFLPQLDFDSAATLNLRLPITRLVTFVLSPELPLNLRNRIAPVVWVRAAMLNRPKVAAAVASAASSARPELKPYIDGFQSARSSAERRFRVAFALAHFPGLRPQVEGDSPRVTRFDYADNYRDNWWCEGSLLEGIRWSSRLDARLAAVPYPAFLSPEERREADVEARALEATGSSGDWISGILIDWAKAHPRNSDAPEALHFSWRVMRFACDGNTKRTREVFLLLHKRYPDSAWTKKTPVWY